MIEVEINIMKGIIGIKVMENIKTTGMIIIVKISTIIEIIIIKGLITIDITDLTN